MNELSEMECYTSIDWIKLIETNKDALDENKLELYNNISKEMFMRENTFKHFYIDFRKLINNFDYTNINNKSIKNFKNCINLMKPNEKEDIDINLYKILKDFEINKINLDYVPSKVTTNSSIEFIEKIDESWVSTTNTKTDERIQKKIYEKQQYNKLFENVKNIEYDKFVDFLIKDVPTNINEITNWNLNNNNLCYEKDIGEDILISTPKYMITFTSCMEKINQESKFIHSKIRTKLPELLNRKIFVKLVGTKIIDEKFKLYFKFNIE
jgi:hypothetical protein